MRRSAGPRLLAWAAAVALLLTAGLWRIDLSYDLGLFLPAPRDTAQTLLVERLGEAPGSRFVLIAVPDDLPRVRTLVDRLGATPGVARVLSDLAPTPARPPGPLWSHRYLLADTDWRTTALRSALEARLSELGLGADADYEALVARDPTLASLALLEALAPGSDRPWTTADGHRVLVAETEAPAFDIGGQATALAGIRAATGSVFPDEAALLSGAGVFGVDLRDTIRREATWRSAWASAAIVVVLLLAYRRFTAVLLAALPLGAGLAAGLAAVALTYGSVHGITLAFGFTLLGVAIDYPLHFLSRARLEPAASALRATWPTLRLGALSTGLAYLALMTGGARGMAQLGLFSAAGIAAALATTRWVLPWLVTGRPGPTGRQSAPPPRLRFGVIALMVAAGGALAWAERDTPWWESDLAALSPVPAERLAREGRLREAIGAPNLRYQVALRDPDLDTVLAGSERVHRALERAVSTGLVTGFGDLTPLLQSASSQAARQAAIPAPESLEARLADATDGLPFDPEAFAGFVADAEISRAFTTLGPEDYAGTALEDALGQYLYRAPDGAWTVVATLRGEPDVRALETLLHDAAPDAALVDLRDASERLVADYRGRLLGVLGIVLVLIAALLTWGIRPGRAAWTLGSVLATVCLTAALLRTLTGPLDLYHLTGLLLAAGLGLDYALFLGKPDGRGARHAVFACMASTVAAFGVLAASAIPALHSLGSAVALGAGLAFFAAWGGTRGGSVSTSQ